MIIKVPAQAWLDEKRIDRHRADRRRNADLSALEGTVELSIPVDLGALATTVTVQFPLSSLMRLNHR